MARDECPGGGRHTPDGGTRTREGSQIHIVYHCSKCGTFMYDTYEEA